MAKIFVSYAHQDQRFVDELKPQLNLIAQERNVSYFDDSQIKPGERWAEVIKRQCETAECTIFLVSPHSLTSEFIRKKELPWLLEAKAKLIPLLVRRTSIFPKWLGDLQLFPRDGKRGLVWLHAEKLAAREEYYAQLCDHIVELLKPETDDEGPWDPFDFLDESHRVELASQFAREAAQAKTFLEKKRIVRGFARIYLAYYSAHPNECVAFAKEFEKQCSISEGSILSRIVEALSYGLPREVPHFPGLDLARLVDLFRNPQYAWLMLGMSYIGKGDYDQALEMLAKIRVHTPMADDCALYNVEMGNCYRKLEQLGQAQVHYDNGLRIMKDWQNGSSRKCECLKRCDANELYLEMTRGLGVVLRKLGVDAYKKLSKSDAHLQHFKGASKCFEGATGIIEKMLRRRDGDRARVGAVGADVYFSYGYYLFEQSFLEVHRAQPFRRRPKLMGSALRAFDRSLELDTRRGSASLSRVALLQIALGDDEKALQSLGRLFALFGDAKHFRDRENHYETVLSAIWTQIVASLLVGSGRRNARNQPGIWQPEEIRSLAHDTFQSVHLSQGPLECHSFDLNVGIAILDKGVDGFSDIVHLLNESTTWRSKTLEEQQKHFGQHLRRERKTQVGAYTSAHK